jgi:clan AA aspartic protease (TIGR02281 family)
MSVSFSFSRGRLILPPAEILHNFPAQPKMALDTGARITVITPRIAEEIGFKLSEAGPAGKVTSATGDARAPLVTIKAVSILGLEVRNVRAICHALPPGLQLDGILGINFLNRFNVEISYETETVTLARWRE